MKQRSFQMIKTNGITLRTVVEGSGPLVILLHGFPQCWYLWRHQIDPLVAAGFQVAVPDQRGYGGSDKPDSVDAYDVVELSRDIAGLATALGQERFIVVGHNWGAPVAWHTALFYPMRVRAVVGMSVPYVRPPVGSMTRQENFGDNFWYIVYFQKPGVAEAELEADVRRSIRTIHYSLSGDAPEHVWLQPNTPASAKLLDGLVDPPTLPSWLTAEDLDYYVEQFEKSGFRGPLNWYRNMDRNIEITPQLEGAKIELPAFFIAGKKDVVLAFADGGLLAAMEPYVPGLRGKVLIEGAGHWIQVERPREVNQALLGFLRSIGS